MNGEDLNGLVDKMGTLAANQSEKGNQTWSE
jgi:hypothetical protein